MQQNNNHNFNLKVASLGSGSKGNATLVSDGKTTVLVDCGFTLKEFSLRCQRLGFSPTDIDAILITHEHQDHINGVGAVSRKFNIPIWTTRGTFLSGKCGNVEQVNYISGFQSFQINELVITPLSVPHDAREPCQFIFQNKTQKLAILTDLGSLTPEITQHLMACHGLLLECNHDLKMLHEGSYPYSLKQRVGGAYGHLNNGQAVELLQQIDTQELQFLIATHLSEKNNCPESVKDEIAIALNWKRENVLIAEQETGFDWLELGELGTSKSVISQDRLLA